MSDKKRRRKPPYEPAPTDSEEEAGPAEGVINIPEAVRERIFRFQVGPAIALQVRAKLNALEPKPFPTTDTQDDAKSYPGFYQIILDGQPVYIGQATRTVAQRLRQHRAKMVKLGIAFPRLQVRYAFVEDLSLVNISEQILIRHFAKYGEAEWNTSGFGSNTQGFGRRGQKLGKIREQFPVDLARPITIRGELTLRKLVTAIDRQSSMDLKIPKDVSTRFQKEFPAEQSYDKITLPFDKWVAEIEAQIAPEWIVHRQPASWYILPHDHEALAKPSK